ncbi:MAG: TetR/AcrR family transcriptional regulator [Promethearchaeota archaeon]
MNRKAREQKDKQRRRNDILTAVERLSDKKGGNSFDKMNMDEIAQEAGLTKPTIYRYFNSKDDLRIGFAAYGYKKISEFMAIVLKTNQKADVSKRLQAISISYYQFARDHAAILKILNDLGRENCYMVLKPILQKEEAMKASGEMEKDAPSIISPSETAYIDAWENFRQTIKQAFMEDEMSLMVKKMFESNLKISPSDFIEVLSIIINGVITELSNRNKILLEHGVSDEDVLAIIMQLLGKGLKS